jgi:hypothetical protein
MVWRGVWRDFVGVYHFLEIFALLRSKEVTSRRSMASTPAMFSLIVHADLASATTFYEVGFDYIHVKIEKQYMQWFSES